MNIGRYRAPWGLPAPGAPAPEAGPEKPGAKKPHTGGVRLYGVAGTAAGGVIRYRVA